MQSSKDCNHVMANVRETGTEISWHGCDFTEAGGFVEHTCNTLDDLPEMNCKRFSSETSKFLKIKRKSERENQTTFTSHKAKLGLRPSTYAV